jgi:pimeloyl-ACP methyl ester carboxylesterase
MIQTESWMTISQIQSFRIPVGTDSGAREIAVEQRTGGGPGLFWLGGFRSDMTGSKALALDALGAEKNLAVTRFDYSGHGISGGDFSDGTISRSSMGGWIALLLAKAMLARGQRPHAMVLIAPAPDMTHELMLPDFTPEEHEALQNLGYVEQPSQYSDTPYRITRALIEDGAQHLLFGGVIETGCPVTILQGGADPDVPQAHAIKLVTHMLHDPVTLTLIPDGDHRLSRDEDLARLKDAVLRLVSP